MPTLEVKCHKDTIPLQTVFLHVTKACNLRCRYCYSSAGSPLPDEMTTEEFNRLWADMISLHPQKIIFTGGEPLLHSDILDLLRSLRDTDQEHRVLRCLNTNGHLVTPEMAHKLVGLIDEARVSVDALQDRNDALRGRGSFEAAMKALEELHAVGFEPKVLITVTKVGLPDLEKLLSLLIEKGVTRINISPLRLIGRADGHAEWCVRLAETRRVVRQVWKRCLPDQPPLVDPPKPGGLSNCGVGSFVNIMPNGDVFPCYMLTSPEFLCGNVREQSLLEICRHNSLFGQLQTLDFQMLARQDVRLVPLSSPETCLSNLYLRTKSLSIWYESLPSLCHSRAKSGLHLKTPIVCK